VQTERDRQSAGQTGYSSEPVSWSCALVAPVAVTWRAGRRDCSSAMDASVSARRGRTAAWDEKQASTRLSSGPTGGMASSRPAPVPLGKPETGLEPVTPCLQGYPGGSPRERMNTRGYWGFGSLDRSGSAVLLPWFTVDFRELWQDCQNPGESA
jgi:hypothetical protein